MPAAKNVGSSNGGKLDRSLPPIKLGYVVVDLTGASSYTGSNSVGKYGQGGSNGRGNQEMMALVNLANATGGVGGRRIDAKGYVVSASASNDQRHAVCIQMTEDDKREVIVDPFVFLTPDDYKCFAQHHAAFFGFVTGTNDAYLRSVAPYIFTTWDSHSRSVKAEVAGLNDMGYFKDPGMSLGVALYDQPDAAEVYKDVMLPALQKLGVTPKVVFKFSTDSSKYGSEAPNAVLQFRQAGVNHIIPEVGLLAYLAFTNAAHA